MCCDFSKFRFVRNSEETFFGVVASVRATPQAIFPATGHVCFHAYLKRFKKRDDESCRYCESLVDNAQHTFFVCAMWGVATEVVGRAVGAQLTPDTMVSLMLQFEQRWMLIETTRASRNCIGACTRDPSPRADLAARVFRGRNLIIPSLVGAAGRFT